MTKRQIEGTRNWDFAILLSPEQPGIETGVQQSKSSLPQEENLEKPVLTLNCNPAHR